MGARERGRQHFGGQIAVVEAVAVVGRFQPRSSSAILRAFSWRAGPRRLGRPIETLRARKEKESRGQETRLEDNDGDEKEESDERRPPKVTAT